MRPSVLGQWNQVAPSASGLWALETAFFLVRASYSCKTRGERGLRCLADTQSRSPFGRTFRLPPSHPAGGVAPRLNAASGTSSGCPSRRPVEMQPELTTSPSSLGRPSVVRRHRNEFRVPGVDNDLIGGPRCGQVASLLKYQPRLNAAGAKSMCLESMAS